jgi:signal transduction histidine kinase
MIRIVYACDARTLPAIGPGDSDGSDAGVYERKNQVPERDLSHGFVKGIERAVRVALRGPEITARDLLAECLVLVDLPIAHASLGVIVHADLSLMTRVVENLLENELTHLSVGCKIAIRLRLQHGMAELVVEDNGPGFEHEIAGRAFERFAKGKGSPGHGLGLAFVAAVIQAHGGAASISGRQGGGAVVTLLLPANVLEPAREDFAIFSDK